MPRKNSFLCEICAKTFTQGCNLARHVKFVHKIGKQIDEGFICDQCKKRFESKFNLIRHIDKLHTTRPGPNKALLKYSCPTCDFVGTKIEICSHYGSAHDIDTTAQSIGFPTYSNFEKWKADLETKTVSKYVKYRTKDFQNHVQYFYRCHRDGFYKPEGENKRALKIKGSNKINGHCPAKITTNVNKQTGEVSVRYCEIHVGHTLELGRLTLSKLERERIAEDISRKIPFKEILNKIRDSVSNSEISRLHLLTRKDLLNIEQIYNLNNENSLHQNDYLSVDAWVERNQEGNENSIVRLYKRQGVSDENFPSLQKEDFLLMLMNVAQFEMLKMYGSDCICIDSTHGMNAYDFQLTTILVLDELRQGFPCVFIFSNRTDETLFRIVFDAINRSVEQPLNTKVFMSDLAPSFYNAWCLSMGPVPTRIFCSWHVDKAWRKQINEKIISLEDRAEVYKMLRTLMEETDQMAFENMLPHAISTLMTNPKTLEFGEYFRNYYSINKLSWAYCYRLHAGLNTNMHLESMHKVLKYIYLEGKNVKRLDKAIHAILNFIRDKLFDRLICLNKGKLTKKITELRKRHNTSLTIKDQCIILQDNDDGQWIIRSSSGVDLYQIKVSNMQCKCNLKCLECDTCIHAYVCSCPDSAVMWNMCKHVHLLRMSLKTIPTATERPDKIDDFGIENDYSRANPEDNILKSLVKPSFAESTSTSNWEANIPNTISKFNTIISMVKCADDLKLLDKALAPLPYILSKESSNYDTFVSVNNKKTPSNKHIEPQRKKQRNTPKRLNLAHPERKFSSTKKRKSVNKMHLRKPTSKEKNDIALNLFND